MHASLRLPLVCGLLASVICIPSLSLAQTIDTLAKEAVVVDTETDTVLFEKNGFDKMFPASMTKMMTVYIVFDKLKHGALKMEDTMTVSENAWRQGGSKMFVQVGTQVSVQDLLRGIIVQSGNDACTVVAESISGTEEAFASLMNDYAKKLGMEHSHFKNSTGWPDEEHVTTPHDLAVLAERLVEDFPEYYPMFAEKEFTYNNIKQPNRNLLLNRNPTVDGLKTGHTEASGYGITVSGVNPEDKRRVVVVVNGLSSDSERADEAEKLLNFGYRNFRNVHLWKAGEPVAKANTWYGVSDKVAMVPESDIVMNLPRADVSKIQLTVHYQGPVAAPIAKGAELGKLVIQAPGREDRNVKLVAGEDVAKLGPVDRLMPNLRYFLFGKPFASTAEESVAMEAPVAATAPAPESNPAPAEATQ